MKPEATASVNLIVPNIRTIHRMSTYLFLSSIVKNYWTKRPLRAYNGGMRPLFHPSIEDVTVEGILHALSDPVRVAIYSQIVASGCPQNCSDFLRISEK